MLQVVFSTCSIWLVSFNNLLFHTQRRLGVTAHDRLKEVETLEEDAFYKVIGQKPPKRQEYGPGDKPLPAAAHVIKKDAKA